MLFGPAAVVALVVLASAAPPAWASSWSISVRAGNRGQSAAGLAPGAPGKPTAVCNGLVGNKVDLSWAAVEHATGYTIWQATALNGTYTSVDTVSGATSWTSGALASGSYWFKVAATVGTHWTSLPSAASGKTTIVILLCS
jgi:hypothetical protein